MMLTLAGAVGLPAAAQQFAGTGFLVNSYTTGRQSWPAVASDMEGNFVVVWRTDIPDSTSRRAVAAQRFDHLGVRRGAEFIVTNPTSGGNNAAVATAADGSFTVVWYGYGPAGSGIVGRRYDAVGTPLGVEFEVNSQTGFNTSSPHVGHDPAGNFVVVWSRLDRFGSGWDLFGRRFDAAGHPVGSEFQVNAYTTGEPTTGAVAMAPDGGFVVVWSDAGQDGSDDVIARRFDSAGSPAGPEFLVNSYTSFSQEFPDVAADGAGNFVVVWTSFNQDGFGDGIFGQRLDRFGNAVGSEFAVNTHTTHDQTFPSVAVAPAGDFVVVWQSYWQNGDFRGIFGQSFQADGLRMGSEFHVNAFYTWYEQRVPAVASLGTEKVVVVWQSNLQDGSD
jgi:hypothetical protein